MNNSNNSIDVTSLVRNYRQLIKEYINQDFMIKMRDDDKQGFKKHMYGKFQEFRENYPKLFDMMIFKEEESNKMLDTMLSSIDFLNKSDNVEEDLVKIRYALASKLDDVYINPKIKK